mmetsp:Transcript_47120/g.73728  ORF Transcript_47120/g.73728 Transcript_47120/m.73728 type:complete len:102 (+) Transcript_47120:68-373(+)
MTFWKIQFDMKHKWANPLMGWTSGKDPLGSQTFIHLNFPTKESAEDFVKKHGMAYRIEEEKVSTVNKRITKAYADNFKWDGDEEDENTGHGMWATKRLGNK